MKQTDFRRDVAAEANADFLRRPRHGVVDGNRRPGWTLRRSQPAAFCARTIWTASASDLGAFALKLGPARYSVGEMIAPVAAFSRSASCPSDPSIPRTVVTPFATYMNKTSSIHCCG